MQTFKESKSEGPDAKKHVGESRDNLTLNKCNISNYLHSQWPYQCMHIQKSKHPKINITFSSVFFEVLGSSFYLQFYWNMCYWNYLLFYYVYWNYTILNSSKALVEKFLFCVCFLDWFKHSIGTSLHWFCVHECDSFLVSRIEGPAQMNIQHKFA